MKRWKVSEIYGPETVEDEAKPRTITQWAEDDRPREKLMAHGAETLSTAELYAILIGSGSRNETAVDLMKRILGDCGNSIAALSRKSVEELAEYRGIGEAKAIAILAASELGRRREMEKRPEREKVSDARVLFELLHPMMRDLNTEQAYVVLMNQGLYHIKTVRLSNGGLTETAVDVRQIMIEALQAKATVIALAHNHPSGNARPSREDDRLTKSVKDACETMRMHFLDHIIITNGEYYSYRDEGRI